MSAIYDFHGKNVTEAIENARQKLGVGLEQLDIEIVTTGSAGIFGFARKDARIRVTVKQPVEDADDPYGVSGIFADSLVAVKGDKKREKNEPAEKKPAPKKRVCPPVPAVSAPPADVASDNQEFKGEIQKGELALLEKELLDIVRLMGFSARVETSIQGRNVEMVLHGDDEAELVGEDGKVLDSLQYLLRKIAGRKITQAVRLNLDVGNYRTRRLAEMKALALKLAEQVKRDGKTQVIPALSPAERREVHLHLQSDSEVRSRSVGEGMFKKVLIYKPGNGKGGRRFSRNRKRTPHTLKEST